MRPRLVDHILDLARNRAAETLKASPEILGVAAWLRGDQAKTETLISLITARIEGRGALDVPSTPHDAAIRAGMDKEARLIIETLLVCERLPMNASSDEVSDG